MRSRSATTTSWPSTTATTRSTRRTCCSPSRSSGCRSRTPTSTTPRSPTTGRTRNGERGRLGSLDRRGLQLPRLGHRGRPVHQPLFLGPRADRQSRLARGPLPAALGRVRRRRPGARLRRRRDGDVPVRDRLPRGTRRCALGRRAELAAVWRGVRSRGDPRRGDRRDRAQGRRAALARGQDRRRLRLAAPDRARVPDRPPARVRDHAQRREPRPDRVLAPARRVERPDLRARGDGSRRLGGRGRPRPDRRHRAEAARPRRRQAQLPARVIVAAWICLVAPLAAALLITLLGTRISRRAAAYVSTTSVLGAFAAAVFVFAKLWSEAPSARSHPSTAWEWLTAGSFHVGLRILVDPLSVFMMLIVTGVGFLIVAYSIGYMEGDEEERRYFAYMALFVFSMLLLVQAGNLVILLAGWGLVGLSSYLLIGFWHDRPAAVAAAKKAFVMNAVGDATMALAFFLLIQHKQTLNFPDAFAVGPGHGWLVNLVALGLLGGAVAKSAQLPLQTWLPDAMEGPTPVSALIHAATMVTAGVYLLVRTHAVFEQAPHVQELAAGLGAGTLLMAGLIALVQTDIKRVIAYSTMSQIGYMFVGAGVGAYANAEFHLLTHAFFKALLFLAAGLVIHALAGEQDIRKMGGVGRLMPVTRITFLIGSLALVGVPPFAGFFSKDPIIAATMTRGWYGYILFVAALIGTFLTGLYAFRLFLIVFPGEPSPFVREHLMRGSHAAGMEGAHGGETGSPHDHGVHERAGEGPLSMTATVAVLAVLAVIGGWIQFAPLWHPISSWLDPVARPLAVPTSTQEALASLFAFLLGLAGIGVAWLIYGAQRWRIPKLALTRRVLEHKFYFDEAYDFVFYRPAVGLARL